MQPARLTAVTKPRPGASLRELVQSRLDELGVTARSAARAVDSAVSYETFRYILRGEHNGRLTPRIAEGLARALQLPVDRIYAAAEIAPPQGEWILPESAQKLTLPQRRVVELMIGSLAEANDQLRRARGED